MKLPSLRSTRIPALALAACGAFFAAAPQPPAQAATSVATSGQDIRISVLCSYIYLLNGQIVPAGTPGATKVGQGIVDTTWRVTITYSFISGSGHIVTSSKTFYLEEGGTSEDLAHEIDMAFKADNWNFLDSDVTTSEHDPAPETDEIVSFSEWVWFHSVKVEKLVDKKNRDKESSWKEKEDHLKIYDSGGNVINND
jgi:hypothetical protein